MILTALLLRPYKKQEKKQSTSNDTLLKKEVKLTSQIKTLTKTLPDLAVFYYGDKNSKIIARGYIYTDGRKRRIYPNIALHYDTYLKTTHYFNCLPEDVLLNGFKHQIERPTATFEIIRKIKHIELQLRDIQLQRQLIVKSPPC